MPRSSHELNQHITDAFVKELEAFQRGGYQFGESGRELFEGTQREAFDAYLDGLKAGHHAGYYEIPTGVGKTALFIAIIGCYLKATENIPDAPRVLIHEPTTDLVVQTAQSFADFLPDIARRMEADDDRGREIDWESSQIDVHHTRRRGAGNKPKVLITTYQGQAADERKPMEQRLHDPAEFGFVIHDEAHYLTGPKFGPAAVDKFQGALQLGVTATPEYSTNKTVAKKLGHRYYKLPLNTAIAHGDLCHVRPIVLKTHLRGKDAIDLRRARDFFAQQRGRPLTHCQLEQLLNQEARNQAIIKAYLTGGHPDTAERFLGQTGMIFAGGITHCNDFILHTQRLLNQPAYRRINQWLRDEGLALIAPIHSQVPPDGVEIRIGGEKTKCTKDQIKELHRRGKILLIISDQELKLGSDFPMDSFIADTVDRFSVPDATQRMGRGFRVDRGDALRGLEPNPEKSCAAINVIDETTHEMYEGTPHHPIHAFEILNGAEHRPPGARKGALTRFREHPPEVSEGLEALGFEFVTKAEALRGIVKTFQQKTKQPLPDKTPQWWNITDVENHPGGQTSRTQRAIAELIRAFDNGEGAKQADGSVILGYETHGIHLQRRQSGPLKQPICFLGEDMCKAGLVQQSKLPPKTPGWWAYAADIRKKRGGCSKRTNEAVARLIHAFETGDGAPHPDGGVVLRFGDHEMRVQRMDGHGNHVICFLADDVTKAGLVQTEELPIKTREWLSVGDIAKSFGGKRARTTRTITELQRAFEAGNGIRQADGSLLLEHGGIRVRAQQMQAGPTQPICYHRQNLIDAGLISEQELPLKTDQCGWYNAYDLCQRFGGRTKPINQAIASLTQAFKAGEGEQLPENIRSIRHGEHSIRMQIMRSGAVGRICFLADDMRKAGLMIEPGRQSLKTERPSRIDLTPGSDHLKRTGRSHGSFDE